MRSMRVSNILSVDFNFLYESLRVPLSLLNSASLRKECVSKFSDLPHMYFQVFHEIVREDRWPKLVSSFEYCWKMGIAVKLSFSIDNSRDYLVVRKCLLADLTAKIIKHCQSLLPPLTPAQKLIFDSFQSCAVVSICSVLSRWSLLPSLLRVLKVSPRSLYFLPSDSFL